MKRNNEPLLRLHQVSRIFTIGDQKVKAVDNISLEIKSGEFLAIQGPSGCGKSTLMYIMGCLDKPTKGEIIFEGENISVLSEEKLAKIRNKKIGFVFQMFNLLPKTTALANAELPLVYSGLNQQERREKAISAIERVGLKDRLNHFPNQLSGGQQQKVSIARALANNPSLILADEPTGNLDSKSGEEIMRVFNQLNSEGNTIVLVTHDKNIAKCARRRILMCDGKIVGNF